MNDDKTAIASAYYPILRGYFSVSAAYYGVMAISHIWFAEAHTFWSYFVLSSVSSFLITYAFLRIGQTQDFTTLSRASLCVNGIVLVNIVVSLQLEFAEAKLTYFVIAALVFALASLSIKQAVVCIGATLFCLMWASSGLESGQAVVHGFIAFAAALSATMISHSLRKAIGSAIAAKVAAGDAKELVETKLTEEISAARILKQRSLTDTLTGLPNRRAFFEAFSAQNSKQDHGWVGLFDLDGFKNVNDSYGHSMGDELLKAVGSRLQSYCGELADVSRIGGDEFALLITYDMPEDQLEVWAQKLLSRLSKTYLIEGRLVNISGSLGFCQIGNGHEEAGLMKNADFALLHAKRSGKNRVIAFNDEHAKAFAEHSRVEHALRRANFEKEITLVFQPQFDLRTQTIVRAEALARWNSPTIGKIAPTEFIKVAEEAGLVSEISITVVRQATQLLKSWDSPIPLAVNLSASDLNCDQTVSEILDLLETNDIDPSLLEFEVTESSMFDDTAKAAYNIQRFADRGHAIAIDDFGTGYSNFNYLRELPITKLKIDRSFLDDLDDPVTEKILRSLAGIAQTLEVECLLEGVEDQLGLLAAKRTGIDLVQGYLVGMPVSEEDLRRHNGMLASA